MAYLSWHCTNFRILVLMKKLLGYFILALLLATLIGAMVYAIGVIPAVIILVTDTVIVALLFLAFHLIS